MSKRQSEDLEDLGLLPDLRRMRLDEGVTEQGWEVDRRGSEPAAHSDKEFTQRNVMEAIADVTNWRDLGLQLGLSSARLNEIEGDEPKLKMITQWMKDPESCWEKLQEALTTPALCENRVAKSIANRRGSSFDKQVVLEYQSSSTISGAIEFTEASVRNAIANVTNIRELGERLKIPSSKLDDIDKLSLENRKQKFVEVWFKVDTDCNWKTLVTAIREMVVPEWKTSKSISDAESSLLSPKSNGSRTNSFSEEVRAEDLKFPRAAEYKNTSMIKRLYSKLNRKIAKKLAEVVEDMEEFHQHILDTFVFKAGDTVREADSVQKIFKLLSEKSYWNFLDVSNLEGIVEEFGGKFLKESKLLINEYKEELKGYKTAIKIAEFMEQQKEDESGDVSVDYTSLEEDQEKYDMKYRTKLSVKLAEKKQTSIKISLQSLFYVEKLWDSLCLDFNLPSLPHVLDDIIKGSIIIHWIVQHQVTWKILEEINDHVGFFEREAIMNVCLEGVCVYNQSKGVRHQKVCYVKLLVTVQEGKVNQVDKTIQECFPNIDTPIDEFERSALLLAVQHGHRLLVKPLLGHGADVYHRDKNGDNVLSLSKPYLKEELKNACEEKMINAAKENDVPLLERAREIGVDLNVKERDDYGWTALLWACDKTHCGAVDYLLKHGADVHAQDSEEWTGLILSSRRGNLDIVRKLLDKGADIHKLSNVRWGALMWASEEGHAHVVKFLLERGAKAEVKDKLGFTPLLQASQDGHLGVVKELVEHDPDIDMDQTANSGWSAVMMATKNGHEDVVRYLVDHGSDVYYQKEDEVTSLHIAGYKGYNSIVRYFCLSKKLKVNTQDKDGITPLMFAVKERQLEVVRTLVENGRADVNIKESANSWTALFFAVEARGPKVLEYLLRSERVDVTHVDDIGNSIVDLAKHINPSALNLLSKHHKKETEIMAEKSRATPRLFTMIPYQKMLDRMNIAVSGQKEVAVSS